MDLAPCKGCEQRFPGCHSKCERYAVYKQNVTKKMAKQRMDQFLYCVDMSHRRIENSKVSKKHTEI